MAFALFPEDGPSGELSQASHRTPREGAAFDGGRQVPRIGESQPWLEELREAVMKLGNTLGAGFADGVANAGTAGIEEALGLVDRGSELLQVIKSAALRAHEQNGSWERRGFKSPEAERAATTRQGYGSARRDMELARSLGELPLVEQALADGKITGAHAEVVTRFVNRGDAQSRRESLNEDNQQRLLAAAQREDATTFRKRMDQLAAQADLSAIQVEHDEVRARRYLKFNTRSGGIVGEFMLDKTAAEEFRVALEAHLPPPAQGDTRSTMQRRADALVAMARMSNEAVITRHGKKSAPRVLVVMGAETLAEATRLRGKTRGEPGGGRVDGGGVTCADGGRGDGDLPAARDARVLPLRPQLPAPPAMLEGRVILPPSELARLLCDSEIGRLVVDAQGQPVDVGREYRTPPRHLRDAVLARDAGCRYPGCPSQARWGEVHHIEFWSQDGETTVENLIVLCDHHHHHSIHSHGDTITAIPGGFEFRRSNGELIGRTYHATRGSPEGESEQGSRDEPKQEPSDELERAPGDDTERKRE